MKMTLHNNAKPEVKTVYGRCPECGVGWKLEVPASGYDRWIQGVMVQKAFPELDAATRELLITGICSSCWDKCFDGQTGSITRGEEI